MTLSLRRSWPMALLMVVALMLLSAGIASAHAEFKSAIPAPDSTVNKAPDKVVAVFENHAALQADGSALKVTDASGTVVDMGDMTLDKSDADRKTLTVSLKSGLGNGTYTVAWAAASSSDGSIEEGSFKFSIGAVASAPATLPATGAGDVLPLEVVLLGACGSLLVGLTLRRRLSR